MDAELLARLGRVDPGLLKPIVHRGEKAQHDRILLLARDGLVRSRTQLVNQVYLAEQAASGEVQNCL